MIDVTKQLIGRRATVYEALVKINQLAEHMVLFVVDEDAHLIGTLTDGDIRRDLVNNCSFERLVEDIMKRDFRSIPLDDDSMYDLSKFRNEGITLVPVVDRKGQIAELVNLQISRARLPLHAVLMAGGEGKRLLPLTEKTPKPLLKIGGKHIIQYNIEHLSRYGIKQITLSICYLADQIRNAFEDGTQFGLDIDYIEEKKPLGTIGALSLVNSFSQDTLLVMNSDLLTNFDIEDFYKEFFNQSAAMAMATVPYKVKIPYGVLETKDDKIINFQEKPSYVYQSNAGIYLLRSEFISLIPEGEKFNATDMMEALVAKGEKVISYGLRSYWLDIGRPEEFAKAEEDIRHIHF